MEQAQDNNGGFEKEKPFRGVITIFYKKVDDKLLFLVIENTKTENVSFVSGAEEDADELSLEKTAQREAEEELGLSPDSYQLEPTTINHEFVFNSKKAERAGKKASYQIYLADITNTNNEIGHTGELKSAKWMTKEEALDSLTFPELKELFEKAIGAIKL